MSNVSPPFFNAQFFDDLGTPIVPLAGGHLFTYISGTTTNQLTYQDPSTAAPNTNPIILDSSGRCNLWLLPTASYTFKLTRADGTLIKTFDAIGGSALATGIVTSVNSLTGAVILNAPLIPFTTGTSTTWFVGTDVAAALDSIITYVNSGVPAASVSIVDAGGYYTSTNVEGALQEVGARSSHGALLRITPFTASGTWTKGSDVSFVEVEGVGGGGGSSTRVDGGGGGGAGGYFKRIVASPGSSETVTIGAGGTPGAVGGSTSFGTWATATGGQPGSNASTSGGAGGTATGATINLQGSGGAAGGNTSGIFVYGTGGGSYFGGGAPGDYNRSAGVAGSANTGGGGSGGTAGGAAGGTGLVMVYEYS